MVEQALHCLEEADTFTAIEFLNQQPDPLDVAAAYYQLVMALYWQQKNISQVVAMTRAGMQYCCDQAEEAAPADMDMAIALRSTAKQLAYNLASFTWPGWNEADIELLPLHMAAGLDAARFNLRLALELDKGDLPLSRAYWMLAGHLLVKQALLGAEANYRRAAMYADRAGEEADFRLAQAFEALAQWLAKPRSSGCHRAYEEARTNLAALEDGESFQEQLDSARDVFMQGR